MEKNKKWIIILILIVAAIVSLVYCMNNKSKKTVGQEFIDNETNNKIYKVKWSDKSEFVEIKNNYYADIVLDENNKTYSMNLTIDVYNDSEDDWDRIYFRDYPSAFIDKENGSISEIKNVINKKTSEQLEFEREDDKTVFYIQLNEKLKPGKSISLSMQYKAFIPKLDARYGYQVINNNDLDFYLANCIPVLCPYDDGKFQYYPYFTVGECFYSRMANYEVNINIPKKYTLIATGDLKNTNEDSGNTSTYSYIANGVRDFAIMIGNSYKKSSGGVDGITINTYFHDEEKAKEALNIAIGTIDSLNDRLGKYPYKTFSVVELQMEMMGMECPQMVLVTTEESGVDASVHEIIHQWFYSLVGNNSYVDPWIDESITTYIANPGLDEYSGIITKPYNEFENDSDYTRDIYFCGASFYNKLEEKYGKEKINKFIEELLEKYAYKEINTKEMVQLLKKYYGENNEILNEYISEKYLK